MVHHTHRELLHPFAMFYATARDSGIGILPHPEILPEGQAFDFYNGMMGGPDNTEIRQRLAQAAQGLTSTNCWAFEYKVVRDRPFLEALNVGKVRLHWANNVPHVPGKKACKAGDCNLDGAER